MRANKDEKMNELMPDIKMSSANAFVSHAINSAFIPRPVPLRYIVDYKREIYPHDLFTLISSVEAACIPSCKDTKNKGIDHQREKLLIVDQILLVRTFGNILRRVWRLCIQMLGCKELIREKLREVKQSNIRNVFCIEQN